jgi:starch-binding outer membrane protein, SusD/RagB family
MKTSLKMKKKLVAVLLTFSFLGGGCNPDILDIKNQGAYDEATYFASAPQFNEGIVAVYSCLLMQGLYTRDAYFNFDLLSGDATNNVFLLGDLAQLQDYSFGSAHPQLTDFWRNNYRMIMRANLMLDKLEDWNPAQSTDQALKRQYTAESRFLRGFAYFMLVSNYGRVPLRLDYDEAVQDAPRAAVADIWQAIEADLGAAVTGLPASQTGGNLGRATQGAAVAMLGKAFLYQKKYPQAQAEFEKLLRAPYTYSLSPNFDALFAETNTATNPEVIFAVIHGPWQGWGVGNAFFMFGGQEAWGGRATHSGRAQEYGWNDWNNVFVSDALVRAFRYNNEAGQPYTDPRARLTFYGDVPSGGDTDYCNQCPGGPIPYPFGSTNTIRYNWRKYCIYEVRAKSELPQSSINTVLVRLADVKLMLAEAMIYQNNTAGALQQINEVRTRVGAFRYAGLGAQDNALTILRRERQMELAGEMHRWMDLNRWGLAQATLNAEKQLQLGRQPFQAKHALLPIPQLEKDTNPLVAADVANEWN